MLVQNTEMFHVIIVFTYLFLLFSSPTSFNTILTIFYYSQLCVRDGLRGYGNGFDLDLSVAKYEIL